MSTRIFETYAPHFWAHGLPVIPLMPRDKRPSINQWSVFGSQMPTPMVQQHWLASFPNGNIGLPFGPASGLCGIDIDTEDEVLIAAIEEILPKTPYVRVGQKGKLLVYRWTGGKNFKLRGADGGMILEHLGLGNQAVMNPSIHPKTQQPYVATANLWEVLADIPEIPVDIEDKMRSLLGVKGFDLGAGGRTGPLDVIPAGERDIQMVRHAGYLARVTMGIDKSQQFSLFEAIQHMHHWVEAFTAKVAGDAMDPDKGVAKLLEFLVRDATKRGGLPDGWDADLPTEWEDNLAIVELRSLHQQCRWTPARMSEAVLSMVGDAYEDHGVVELAVQKVIARAAKDPDMSDFAMQRFRVRVEQLFPGFKVPWSAVRQAFKDARLSCGMEGGFTDHFQIASTLHDELQHLGEVRFDQWKFWQWQGSRWEEISEDMIFLHLAQNIDAPGLIKKDGDYGSVLRIMRRLSGRPLAPRRVGGTNFLNGFLSVDGQLLDHHPDFGCTYTMPFEYRPELRDQCPRWLSFLADCWGDEDDYEDRVMALQEAFAATITGTAVDYQRAFLLFGHGGTGKSQILKIVEALLPKEAVSHLGVQQWNERFALSQLTGKVANIAGELPEQGKVNGSVFKQVVDGSPMYVEFKNKDGFSFSSRCAQWSAGNHLPFSSDYTNGFARRWLIFDFNYRVPDSKKVTNLAELIVTEEGEAIIAWALAGLDRLTAANGYTLPASHERRISQMRIASNSVLSFVSNHRGLVRDAKNRVAASTLYDLYRSHMKDGSLGAPMRQEGFLLAIEELGFKVSQEHDAIGYQSRFVEGISLVSF